MLYFLDYLVLGIVNLVKVEVIVVGVVIGCCEVNVVLIGGEIVEMFDMYEVDVYDMVGFVVGIVEKS